MKRFNLILVLLLLAACGPSEQPKYAKNVILFVGDGTGIPTINATSIYGYGQPQRLFVQQMPHLGLSDTSAADTWVSDSAAGMTAIMTGQKTNNGIVSQSEEAIRGQKDGAELKTLLEYAEERGLMTGVVSNSSMADATPAACYAHSNDRGKTGEIFAQILSPAFGDGVDVVIGPGRQAILNGTKDLGFDLEAGLQKMGYAFVDQQTSAIEISENKNRLIALYPDDNYDLEVSVEMALNILGRSENGFFLMVESNNHSKDIQDTLERFLKMDQIIQKTVKRMAGTDTLIIFTADHSYDIRIPKAPRTQNIVEYVAVDGSHTAEEVLVAATGPGSEKIRGMFPNTRLFEIMMEAYGWSR